MGSIREGNQFALGNEFWLYKIVDLAADTSVFPGVPCLLGNIWVHTVMSAHPCPIMDGAATLFSLPQSSAVGTIWSHMKGMRVENLTVDPDNAATGMIVVQYLPLA